jgi:hypothetical protein
VDRGAGGDAVVSTIRDPDAPTTRPGSTVTLDDRVWKFTEAHNMAASQAIQHCERQLGRARDSLCRLEPAVELAEAEEAWSDFIGAASRIYSKLEQGSKGSGKAKAWFGRIKHERKTDPLLSYIHHARNSDEHAIEDITAKLPRGAATFSIREPYDASKLDGKQITIGADSAGRVVVTDFDPELFEVISYPKGTLLLSRITDARYGDAFDPPKHHLGKALDDLSPFGVAKLVITYLEQLVEGARQIGI